VKAKTGVKAGKELSKQQDEIKVKIIFKNQLNCEKINKRGLPSL